MLADPLGCQEKILHELVRKGKLTLFGSDHFFSSIKSYEDFKDRVPLRNYEDLLPYVEKIKQREANVLWPGRPLFLGKSSGTTSKTKYIPVTRASLKNQIDAPQYAIINYAFLYKKYSFLKGRVLIFSNGHFFEKVGGFRAATISTIANSCIPSRYKWLRLPSDKINALRNYDERIKAMISVSVSKGIRSIVAMPVWLLVYLRALKKQTGKRFRDLFPNFKLLLLSGMDYDPYLSEIKKHIDMPCDVLETYPSTEGFIAYQDRVDERGMQLVLNHGIFFEFVPVDELTKKNPGRLSLTEVLPGIDYALVLNTNAGLWGYIIGDTIKFKTLFPHRIILTGRITQFISAFGEHVTLADADKSITAAAAELGVTIVEFSVAPHIKDDGSMPYHEWFIEFGISPVDLNAFEALLEQKICLSNFTYLDEINNRVIAPLKITRVPAGGFELFLNRSGKTGLQQKVPHLSNNYQIAKCLNEIIAQLSSPQTNLHTP